MVNGDIIEIKRHMAEIEDSFPMGRLFDIDVMSASVPGISREKLGLAPRECLLCGKNAALCARSRAHGLGSLIAKTVEIIWEYFAGGYAEDIAGKACRALLYEVAVTPKPGLVDFENNGSHRDMDRFTFIDSICSLYPYFRSCALKGIEFQDEPAKLFKHLRCLGKEAEYRMKRATGGINTHKGAIFSMGLFCAAAGVLSEDISQDGNSPESAAKGRFLEKKPSGAALAAVDADVYGKGRAFDEKLSETCREICAGLLDDFDETGRKKQLSSGEEIYLKYKVTGIRGEAAQGFPSVFETGLPLLRAGIACGKNINDAALAALFALMSRAFDTNVIARSDTDTLRRVQEKAEQILISGAKAEDVRKLNEEFVKSGVSPGGSADLLALCCFCLSLS